MRHKFLFAGLIFAAMIGLRLSPVLEVSAQVLGGKHAPVQAPDTAKLTVMRVRGGGEKPPEESEAGEVQRARVVPVPLTPIQKQQIAGQFLTEQSFVLSPNVPIIQGKGKLDFINAKYVSTEANLRFVHLSPFALFESQTSLGGGNYGANSNDKIVQVIIQPDAVHRFYLVDCLVADGENYFVRVMPGSAVQSFDDTNHLVLVYDSATSGNFPFTVNVAGKTDATRSRFWTFFSCEITPFDTH
jgi:hypothetical protein